MPKLTSKPKSKAIKKSNHRVFGIVFSALIIIALLAMIPLTLMSLKNEKGTDERSQAFDSSTVPASSDHKWLYVNTSVASTFPQTRWESNTFDVPANENVRLAAAMLPYNLQDSGVTIALVCTNDVPNTDNDCPKPLESGSGYVKNNEFLSSLTFNNTTAPINSYKVHARTLKFPQGTKAQVKIFAHKGSEAYIDFARLEKLDATHTKLNANSDFAQSVTRNLSRPMPTLSQYEDKNNAFFIRPLSYTSEYYSGYLASAPLDGQDSSMIVARSFGSDRNNSEGPQLEYEYRFKPTQLGTHAIRMRLKVLKKSPHHNSVFNTRNWIIPSTNGTNNQNNCILPSNTNNQFVEVVCSTNITKLDNSHFFLLFGQTAGSEVNIDWIKTIGPNNAVLQNSFFDSFLTNNIEIKVKQPAQWTSGAGNFNDYLSRWTARGEY